MKHSAGVIPYKIVDDKVYFFVGHPGGTFWKNKNYWSLLKGEVKENERVGDTAIREFNEESGLKLPQFSTLIYLGNVKQNSNKIVTAFAWHCKDDIDVTKCHSNMADNGLNPEIDEYKWMLYDEIIKCTHKTHIGFYKKIIKLAFDEHSTIMVPSSLMMSKPYTI